MNLIKRSIFALCLILVSNMVKANTPSVLDTIPSIPRVFVLGQYDGAPFERMKSDYETSLLTVCKNDVETAYYCWAHLLKHLETHAAKSNFDMNGIKLWLYVFWEKDGSIGYLAYYPKPNSKNFKAEEMTALLNDFSKKYISPVKNDKAFSNYSAASFPVMIEKSSNNGSGSVNTKGTNRHGSQNK